MIRYKLINANVEDILEFTSYFSQLVLIGTYEGNVRVYESPEDLELPTIGTAYLVKSQAPSPMLTVCTVDLEEYKSQKIMEINERRDTTEANGFEAFGKLLDSDEKAIRRISLAAQAAQAVGENFTIDWTCKDNSTLTLGYQQMMLLPVIMAQAGNAIHQYARQLKASVSSATTLEEVEAIVWQA